MKRAIVLGIFCYNRLHKLQRCIEALLKNPECSNMEVVFFSDGPKNLIDKVHVESVRSYIEQVTGFKNVIKVYNSKNLSTGPSFEAGLKFLSENYDAFIVVEDDLVVSPNFISYVMEALTFYKDDLNVFCITGYVFPLDKKNYQYDTLVYDRFCSWGWGTWSERLTDVVWDNEKLLELSQNIGFKKRLNAQGKDLFRMLKKQISGTISTWDIQMQVHVSKLELKVIYPVLSKVDNVGFDNESTNTFGMNYLLTPLDDGTHHKFKFCNVDVIIPDLQRQISKPYRLPALVQRKLFNDFLKGIKIVKNIFELQQSPNQSNRG